MKKTTNPIIADIRQTLIDSIDLAALASSARYHKEAEAPRVHGVRTGEVSKIAKEGLKQIKHQPKKEILELREELWQAGYLEESIVACIWAESLHKQYKPADFKVFNRWKLVLLLFFTLITQSTFAILPDTVYIRKPEELGLMYKELEVKTNDEYHIATWFFPAQNSLSESELEMLNGTKRKYETLDKKKRPTIIICNGDAGNMSYFQLHLAEAFCNMGFNVVTFDWRGFGASTYFPMDKNYLCYTEMLEDYNAVINTVAQQPEVRKDAIVLMGWSTGAYLSMITAHDNNNVSAFIGRSLPTTFDDFIPLVMKVRNKTKSELIVPANFPTDKMPIRIAPKFRKPIFLINGENDIRTPVWMSRKVLDLLPSDIPRELMVVKNAAHGGKEDPIMIDFDNFIDRVSLFLAKNIVDK